ncbi:transcriptional regulator, GntR family [Vibrio xiamenensis]|uniref:Transcriptional regulator, GntR family n=1 Tax=Vibrio xiamenensis TaxID=861298 RepID=A0A1G7XWJ8_9VIBR|nr:UTRA domain-containing protein [Vibrio xiamenensis]SDG77206.1 transcriptional regulator, GntR family [Vibrio xiamenensis]SDG88585.1 transcriptional regulator, GntR family [Vibrio xiamenensis]
MAGRTTQLSKIKAVIREQIAGGVITAQQKLPSERELCERFATTRITIKDALSSLETEGLIYREERKGWFVSPPRVHYNPLSRSHFHQMIHDQHRIAETRLLSVETQMARSDYARVLERSDLPTIHLIRRLRYIDGRAVLYVENCLISELFEGILSENLTASLTQLYEQKYGYTTSRSRFDVIPTAAPDAVAKALGIASGQQVLKICRVNYNQFNQIIDCEFEYWRPDSVMITIDSY